MATRKNHNQPCRTDDAASHSDTGAELLSLTTKNPTSMKSKGILLLLALVLVIPSERNTLRNISKTVSQSFKSAFSALNKEAFAATSSSAAYASGIAMEFYALEEQEIVLSLSRPGEPGRLKLNTFRGSVEISGYDGNEVVVRYDGAAGKRRERQEPPEGMRRITGPSPGFEATEDNNVVTIRSEAIWGATRFRIKVPENFSATINLVQADTLAITNLSGDLEINQVSGGVSLMDISGAALVNTVNGDIVTVFENVSTDKPMSFNTLTGDIDLSFPSGSQFTARLRSEFGEMFTDFDMDIREDASPGRNSSQSIRIPMSETVVADVNGGGPEYRITTLQGNIYLRKH